MVTINNLASLTLVGGITCSGKTEFSNALARQTEYILLDDNNLSSDQLLSTSQYNHMDPIWENIENGKSIIVASPFEKEFINNKWFNNIQNMCSSKNIQLKIYWLDCEKNILKERILKRGLKNDEWKIKNYEVWEKTLPNKNNLPTRIKIINTSHIKFSLKTM